MGQITAAGWPLSSTTQHFVWPLKGRVLLMFGEKEDRVSLKGIVIQAKPGERVVASRDGRVKLIDQKLKGYGKTIILEHPDEFYTVYARNSEISVTLGEWVRQGQPIAEAGPHGRGKLATLYFEIRKSAKVEDPLRYLRS